MTNVAIDTPIIIGTAAELEPILSADLPVLLYVYAGESLRGDVRIEIDQTAKQYAGRLLVVKADTSQAPEVAQFFELNKHPVLISWANGAVVARRPRPWGTDVKGMVEELAKLIPASAVVAVPVEEQAEAKAVVESKPIKVTDTTFEAEVLNSPLPVLVDFWADWCGPCKQIAPILEKLAKEFAGKIRIAKVDVDRNPQLQNAFQVMSIPTLMFVKSGKIVGQQAGALPEHIMRDAINQLINLKVPA